MFKHVIDEDVELRLLDNNHAMTLLESINYCRDYLRQWLPWVDGTQTIEDAIKFIEMAKRQYASNEGFQAGIWYKDEFAGVIGYYGINWFNRSVNIGYWLDKRYMGRGVMTKACRVFIDYAFNTYNLNRAEIRCAEDNHRSRAIAERLGFTKEGIIREAEWLYNHYVNHIVYGMLASEWKK
ncbi:GNAT family N-acetyltransferase [Lutispora thermophila]|uniref:Ribosomal-protein-serine acetyltransferase n=1 Tax=Lutispora thermophila DSM 19022 TaxID=1122184 RepID=A0A1M6E401_9FIRM|nr:GNAT family protein [Lutispora thermophila]SHI80227.1 ribosomal-protein-serine acetyltransferase [Lutispora thermophila DSM 19022]